MDLKYILRLLYQWKNNTISNKTT